MELRYVLVLARKWLWLLLLAGLIGGVAGFVVNLLLPKTYESDTTLFITSSNRSDNSFLLGDQQEAKAFASFLQSPSVLSAAIQEVGDPSLNISQLTSQISVNNNSDTQFVSVSVRDRDPQRAAQLARAITHQSIVQFQATINDNDKLQFMQEEMDRIETEIKNLQEELLNVQAQPNPDPLLQANSISRLNATLGELQLAYSQLATSYEVGIQIKVVQPAIAPTQPIGTGPKLAIAIGMLVGLIVIVAVILFIEQSDDIVRTPAKVQQATNLSTFLTIQKLPAIVLQSAWLNGHHEDVDSVDTATVKRLTTVARHATPLNGSQNGVEDTKKLQNVSADTSKSLSTIAEQAREARGTSKVAGKRVIRYQLPNGFLTLAVLLQSERSLLSSNNNSNGSLLITSPESGNGKTVTASQLALGLARIGIEVVLIDANLYKPEIHTIFGLSNKIGLSTILSDSKIDDIPGTGIDPISAVLQQAHEPHLTILPSGPLVDAPSELLSSARMTNILQQLCEKAMVLIDCPAVLTSSDAVILANKSDNILMVVDAHTTSSKVLKQALEILQLVNLNILGAVLNRADE